MRITAHKTDRSRGILEAAGDLFARYGYHGTSTREIARVVGISENTLFRYFDHKEEIFWDALAQRLRGLRLRQELLEGLRQGENPETLLPKLIAQIVDFAVLNPEILRLVSVAFLELPWKASAVCREHLAPAFAIVKGYFERSSEQGRVRGFDPALTATAVGMTVLAHFELAKFGEGAPFLAGNRKVIDAHSEFWLGVLVPGFQVAAAGLGGRGSVEPPCDDPSSVLPASRPLRYD